MAITKTETQITWASSNSVSVTAGSNQTSDTVTLDDTCVAATVIFKADNSTTAASDDIIYFYILEGNGDPDGTGSDEFTTTGHAFPVAVLSTFTEDPAVSMAVSLNVATKNFKIYAEGATAGTTNAITVSATVYEQRVA